MAIISRVGRKSWRIRITYFFLYFVLSIGAVTMVYPFLIMLSGSVANRMDYEDNAPVPRFIYDDDYRYRKYIFE